MPTVVVAGEKAPTAMKKDPYISCKGGRIRQFKTILHLKEEEEQREEDQRSKIEESKNMTSWRSCEHYNKGEKNEVSPQLS